LDLELDSQRKYGPTWQEDLLPGEIEPFVYTEVNNLATAAPCPKARRLTATNYLYVWLAARIRYLRACAIQAPRISGI
jgi:hypothetical protein